MSLSSETPENVNEEGSNSPTTPQYVFSPEEIASYKEQDRTLPIANIARIMKDSVPEGAKISKEAKSMVQECVSEFISFVASEAAEKCNIETRKTLAGEDLLYAMSSLGLDNYAEVCKIFLVKLREHQAAMPAQNARRRLSQQQEPEDDEDDAGEED